MTDNPTRAHVEYDFHFGVRAVISRPGRLRVWGYPEFHHYNPEARATPDLPDGQSQYLHLEEDEARALYEALADYFGGSGHDTRALRRDYDAERARVDRLLAHLTAQPPTVRAVVEIPRAIQ